MQMQHCNRLYTGYCMSCGGYETPTICDECGREIGDFDEWHEIDAGGRTLCDGCYEEWLHDEEEDDMGDYVYPEQMATLIDGATGLSITTVTGRHITARGPVRYHDEYGLFYCDGASWDKDIVTEVLMDESRSA